jgi:hypothetical protein
MSLEPDGYVLRMIEDVRPAPAPPAWDALRVPALPPRPGAPVALQPQTVPQSGSYGPGRQELGWFGGVSAAPDHRAIEAGIRLGDVVGRVDTILVGAAGEDGASDGAALVSAYRGWPVEVQAHLFAGDEEGAELRGSWSHRLPAGRLSVDAGVLAAGETDTFAAGQWSGFRHFGAARAEHAVRIDVYESVRRGMVSAGWRTPDFRVAARYRRAKGDSVALGGVASSVLPRSFYAGRILDPALPGIAASGGDYDGWEAELAVRGMPASFFYRRHHTQSTLSLAGIEISSDLEPNPILKLPGLALTAGAARIFDEPFRGDTNWWVSMRWRP